MKAVLDSVKADFPKWEIRVTFKMEMTDDTMRWAGVLAQAVRSEEQVQVNIEREQLPLLKDDEPEKPEGVTDEEWQQINDMARGLVDMGASLLYNDKE